MAAVSLLASLPVSTKAPAPLVFPTTSAAVSELVPTSASVLSL